MIFFFFGETHIKNSFLSFFFFLGREYKFGRPTRVQYLLATFSSVASTIVNKIKIFFWTFATFLLEKLTHLPKYIKNSY